MAVLAAVLHVAVGGYDVPNRRLSSIPVVDGGTGENDTASYHPIFFLHHCFVDRTFWL